MSFKVESCVPLPLEEKQLHDLVEKAKDYLLMHGKDIFNLNDLLSNTKILRKPK